MIRLATMARMQKLKYGKLIAGLTALALVIGATWIVLEYLVPSPPFRVTIATGRKGTTFDYFGERYRTRFARAGVELNVRETAGGLENLKLLRDRNSNVQIAFSTGGISNSTQAPELRSMGLISNVPFWIFYSSSESLDSLPQLKGKRIAVGPEGSGARYDAERILRRANSKRTPNPGRSSSQITTSSLPAGRTSPLTFRLLNFMACPPLVWVAPG